MAGHLAGCAMGGSSDEEAAGTGDETFAEESSGDFAEGEEPAEGEEAPADGEVAEGEEAPAEGDDLESEVAEAGADAAPGEGDELGGDDLAVDGGDELAGDLAAEGDDELSLDDEGGLPSDVAGNDQPPIIDEPAAAPTDAPVFADAAPEAPVDAAPAEPKVWAPLKKMKTAAFDAGGTNLNRCYVARPGDTKQGVAEKLYGDKKRAKDLSKWNGFLSRGVKTGDKIYYSSPTNPTDTNMMTYYEDIGVPSQNYATRDGDNIREVAKTLLGDKESWKEIWVTNQDIESKGDLASGLNVRYWPEGSAPAPILAGTDPAPPQDPSVMDPLAAQQPPPTGNPDPLAIPPADPLSPGGLAPNDPVALNPPDPVAAPTGTPASEAPPVVGSTEQPPPTEKPPRPVAVDPSVAGTEEADNMMMMGLGGIVLLAAGAVFFLMRSRRSRKVDLTQTTQVG